MSKAFRCMGVFACALLITLALGMDMAVEPNLRPDGLELFGYLYQLLGRFAASFWDQRLISALLMLVSLWFCARYLYHKPAGTGAGEYVLCGFLGFMMLMAQTVQAQETVAVLWENAFQACKTLLAGVGLSFLFLMLLRGLREGMAFLSKAQDSNPMRWFDGHNSKLKIAGWLLLVWLPQIVARYPGVIMWDSYWQIHQFFGNSERVSSHPPFGTLMYGSLAALGDIVGSRNTIYFCFTLLQYFLFIAVLTYSMTVMKRQKVNGWFRMGVLLVYAFSPCYSAWAGTIAKDAAYQIGLLLAATQLLVVVNEREHFFKSWTHSVLMGIAFLWMSLNRHNGAPLSWLLLVGVVLLVLSHKKCLLKIVICSVAGLLLSTIITETITSAMQIKEPYMRDLLSLPMQQTARVVSLHQDEIPADEAEAIDQILQYDQLADVYADWYADMVKNTYRQSSTAQDRMAYLQVWFRQMLRWPVDYLDAMLHMNGVLFDLNDNNPMYVSLSNTELYNYVYPYSFNDLSLYESEELIPFDSAQRLMAEWYMDFDQIPLIGLAGSMSFHIVGMLMLVYLCWTERCKKKLIVWIPGLFTFGMCLFAPVVYLRYALPLIGAFPVSMACMLVQPKSKRSELE